VAGEAIPLFGPTGIDYREESGGRLTAGTWCDQYGIFGIDVGGFWLQERTALAHFASDALGQPPLAIPFFNGASGPLTFLSISIPGQTTGRIDIFSSTQLWGVESNVLLNFMRSQHVELEGQIGFRYAGLREELSLGTTTTALEGGQLTFGGMSFGPPAGIQTLDRFRTETDFYGAQLGGRARLRDGGLFVDLAEKVALGDSAEEIRVAGTSTLLAGAAGPVQTLGGGVFAQGSNGGRRSDDEFTVIAETQVKLGYEFGKHVSAFVGYDFLYWSRVVRPGKELDTTLSPLQIPSSPQFNPAGQASIPFGNLIPLRPGPLFNSTDFWAQGFNLGLEFQY
jgi:hypothetical protein